MILILLLCSFGFCLLFDCFVRALRARVLLEICAYLPRITPLWSPCSRTEGRDTNPNEHLCFNTEGQRRTCAMRSGSLSKQSALFLSECRWTAVIRSPGTR